jgi:hypothetical protein
LPTLRVYPTKIFYKRINVLLNISDVTNICLALGMEYKDAVYLPSWVKITALIILAASCMGGLYLAYVAISKEQDKLLDPAFSLIQFSSIGFTAALVLFYTERELSIKRLSDRLDKLFTEALFDAMKQIRIPELNKINGVQVNVSKEHERGQPRAFYTLEYDGYELIVQVEANMKQILVMYYYPVAKDIADLQQLTQKFTTMKEAEKVGWVFSSSIEKWTFDGNLYLLLYFRIQLETNFLLIPTEMLFWVTDISIMSRHALLKGIEEGVLSKSLTLLK